MFRYFIYLAYDGTNYHGWQIQPNGSSVQETLMKALHTFYGMTPLKWSVPDGRMQGYMPV